MFGLFNFTTIIKNNSRGAISLLVVLSILAAISAIALGSSFIISSELKLSSNVSDSVVAFYAAESGIERALYEHLKTGIQPTAETCSSGNWTVVGSAKYCLNITQADPLDHTTISAIQSIGEYGLARRSVEISF